MSGKGAGLVAFGGLAPLVAACDPAALEPPDGNGWLLQNTFASSVIAVSGQPVGATGYVWPAAPTDSATFPLPGGGWALAVNHGDPDATGAGGASFIEFAAAGSIVTAGAILTGTINNRGGAATPDGTWLSAEQTSLGKVWECDVLGTTAAVQRPAFGRFRRGSLTFDATTGAYYVTEAEAAGGLYRFTPDVPGDLTAGTLDVLTETAGVAAWTPVPEPTGTPTPTRLQVPDTVTFDGGAGIDAHDGRIVFATSGTNQLWLLDPTTPATTPLATVPGAGEVVVVAADAVYATDGAGQLQLARQDGATFVVQSLPTAPGAELAGPSFAPSRDRLFVNTPNGGGATYQVCGSWSVFDYADPLINLSIDESAPDEVVITAVTYNGVTVTGEYGPTTDLGTTLTPTKVTAPNPFTHVITLPGCGVRHLELTFTSAEATTTVPLTVGQPAFSVQYEGPETGAIYDPHGQLFLARGFNAAAGNHADVGYFTYQNGGNIENNAFPWATLDGFDASDVADMKANWDFNLVRLNIDATDLVSWGSDPALRSVIQLLTDNEIVAMPEVHKVGAFDTGLDPGPAEVADAATEWAALAQWAAANLTNPDYLWCNPLNEPSGRPGTTYANNTGNLATSSTAWLDWNSPITDAFRAHLPCNIVVWDDIRSGQGKMVYESYLADQSAVVTHGTAAKALYENWVGSVHAYGWWSIEKIPMSGGQTYPPSATYAEAQLAMYFADAKAAGLAVFVGELGGNNDETPLPGDEECAMGFFNLKPAGIGAIWWAGLVRYSSGYAVHGPNQDSPGDYERIPIWKFSGLAPQTYSNPANAESTTVQLVNNGIEYWDWCHNPPPAVP
ncbi:MAG: cellulase family glycosylhydrolase [Acidimicrobiales bacterium]|nr:cellulase family glycosylhydrolase [Acidimicrobiales bacterium]